MAVDLLRARHQRGRYSAQTLRQSKRRQSSNLGPSGSSSRRWFGRRQFQPHLTLQFDSARLVNETTSKSLTPHGGAASRVGRTQG